ASGARPVPPSGVPTMARRFFRSHRSHRPAGPSKITLRQKSLSLSLEQLESRLAPAATAQSILPLVFEANAGQTDSQVQFLSRGSGYTLFLTPTQAVLELLQHSSATSNLPSANPGNPSNPLSPPTGGASSSPTASVVRMQLLGANTSPQMIGLNQLSS